MYYLTLIVLLIVFNTYSIIILLIFQLNARNFRLK